MKTKLPSVLQFTETGSAKRRFSMARIAGIAIAFSTLGFLLSWHYDNPGIFWITFGGTNLIITIFLTAAYFIHKHEAKLRFYLPALLWIYGLMQFLLIVWEVFWKKH